MPFKPLILLNVEAAIPVFPIVPAGAVSPKAEEVEATQIGIRFAV